MSVGEFQGRRVIILSQAGTVGEAKVLKDTIRDFVSHALEEGSPRDVEFVAECVRAVIDAGRVSVAAIARKFDAVFESAGEKRIRAFFRRFRFDEVKTARALVTRFLSEDAESPLVLATDPTHVGHCSSITTAIVTKDRALPILRTVIGPNEREKTALKRHYRALRQALPRGANVIVLGDGAFGHTRMMKLLKDELGMNFILRTQPQTCVRRLDIDGLPEGATGIDFVQCRRLIVRDGIVQDLGVVGFSRKEETATRVLLFWNSNFPHPWCLVTSLTCSALAVVELYTYRFNIEHFFRDEKSQRFGMGLDGYAYADPHRLSLLQLVSTLAYHILVMAGKYAMYRRWRQYTERTTRQLSLWRIGRNLLNSEDKDRFTSKSLHYIGDRLPLRVKGLLKYTPPVAVQQEWSLAQEHKETQEVTAHTTLEQRLRELCAEAHLTQVAVASKLGVSRQRVNQIFAGGEPVPAGWLSTFTQLLGKTEAELTEGTSWRPPRGSRRRKSCRSVRCTIRRSAA